MIWPAAQHDDPARNGTARVIGALTGRTGRAQPQGAPGRPTTRHGRWDQRHRRGRGHYVANRGTASTTNLAWEAPWTPFTWNPLPQAVTAPCYGSTATSTRTPPRNCATG